MGLSELESRSTELSQEGDCECASWANKLVLFLADRLWPCEGFVLRFDKVVFRFDGVTGGLVGLDLDFFRGPSSSLSESPCICFANSFLPTLTSMLRLRFSTRLLCFDYILQKVNWVLQT
jgi:hypothetical protein